MGAAQRVKGQEVQVLVIRDGTVDQTLTAIRNFEVTFQLEILKEGYLNEVADRRDEIYKGMAGRFELHIETKDIFDLIKAIVARATRRTPGTVINIKATLNMPNGDRPKIVIPNCAFGDLPVGFGAREQYGNLQVTFESGALPVVI